MPVNAHQMEQQYSTRSLSDGSEMGSGSVLESGLFMTSFTATIFFAGLVIAGILLITLLVSLALMLQSCQSKNSGVIEVQSINDDYSYCKIYALHAELNNMNGYDLPQICRALAIQYVIGGQYARDLETTKSVIEGYFNYVRPSEDGLDVVLMDMDDLFPSYPSSPNLFHGFHNNSVSECLRGAKNLKLKLILRLYMNLETAGWPIILLSRKPGTRRNVTTYHLISAGFSGWSSLMMREEDEDSLKGNEYFSRQRNEIQKKGFRIRSVISNHMHALTVSDSGMQNFKLPDPICDKFEHQMENADAGF